MQDTAQRERLQRLRKGEAVPAPIDVTLDLNGPETGRLGDGFLDMSHLSESESVLVTSELPMITQRSDVTEAAIGANVDLPNEPKCSTPRPKI